MPFTVQIHTSKMDRREISLPFGYDISLSHSMPAAPKAKTTARSDRSRVPSKDTSTVQQYESIGIKRGRYGPEINYQSQKVTTNSSAEIKYGTVRANTTTNHEHVHSRGNFVEGMKTDRYTTSTTQSARVPVSRAIKSASTGKSTSSSTGGGSRGGGRGRKH